ncbi:TPA: peptide deformylase [Candidatus Campbellbacteria bacterium]|nr:MAG: peptide deformylase, peptide deformylase [Candidatus Campbellbacteria bacterium GW2011_OD1_34_28]KKP74838.1 MAG: Peptide deformylase [Candidatus Campbellbacteria bacterium GW2011_GWD2_35_24]KKP75724.1 MAG: peptide deformylase, peptide deformylase [Candidatus Campbellbacteria bacterium GW2011_GWC2_35_28]KKP77028.1 MAG: Peptide deformylase [Candidatus Campbellbacteria bacterium GW2011_GWC1_35_31]KKP78954.1 MAG: Peptide deformylase [Candidatus Campbellbacteria bacterium GW2011_GWD1_35_49]
MLEILQKGNPILNKKASEIKPDDISSTQIQDLIKEMKEILSKKNDGAALAAPQIGKSVRLFIIAENVFTEEESNMVFINPKIIEQSEEKEWMEEGCLSVKGIYGKVNRSTSCTIRAYDLQGEIFTQKGHGLISQIFQHEVDHLNGILFTEKAKDLFQVDDENQNKKL